MSHRYPFEFRRRVLDLLAAGRSVASVAADLGVRPPRPRNGDPCPIQFRPLPARWVADGLQAMGRHRAAQICPASARSGTVRTERRRCSGVTH